jgi:hypothetical protein
MLIIAHTLAPSFGGLGVFAVNPIMKGSVVWELNPRLDRIISPEEHEMLVREGFAGEFLDTYAYRDMFTGHYVLCADDARFINHSETPNVGPREKGSYEYGMDVALRDIAAGEEILINYDHICMKGRGF